MYMGHVLEHQGLMGNVWNFLKQKIKNYPFTVVGDGNQKKRFYICYRCSRCSYKMHKYKKNCQIFNVGSGQAHSVNKICSLLGGKKQSIPLRPGEPRITFADIKKFQKS